MPEAMGWVDSHRSVIPALAAITLTALSCAQTVPAALADSLQPSGLGTTNALGLSPASLYPIGGPAMTTARSIAERHWQGEPCRGKVAIAWAAMGSSVTAIATWANRSGAYADPARNDRCSVRFNSDQAFDWPTLCTVFVHEFGHLTGHPHASDASDVMYPIYTVPLPACADAPTPATGPASGAVRQQATGRAAGAGRSHRRHRRHRRGRAQRSHQTHRTR